MFRSNESNDGDWRYGYSTGIREQKRHETVNPKTFWPDLSVYMHPKVDKRRASLLREQCIRKGDMFGPEAIAAVSGYGTGTTNAISSSFGCGLVTGRRGGVRGFGSEASFGPSNFYDERETEEMMVWARQLHTRSRESSTTSSASCSPRSAHVEKIDSLMVDDNNRNFSSRILRGDRRFEKSNGAGASQLISSSITRQKPTQSELREPVAKMNLKLGAPFGGAEDSKTLQRMNWFKDGRKVAQATKKPSRKRRQPLRKKSSSTNKSQATDIRHKGPKIHGCFTESNLNVLDEQAPTIRTVVLPYPQPKYRHTM